MEQRPSDRFSDALSGPPDSTRPRNPWPRLLAFFAVVALGLVLVGVCIASFASPPPRELRVDTTEMEPTLPRFFPVVPFGADPNSLTYGAWVTYDGQQAFAFLARQPETTCRLTWDATRSSNDNDGRLGAFVDPCGDARYNFTGQALDDSAPKDMDVFPARIEAGDIVVDLTRLRLGHCREDGAAACSPVGEARFIEVPRNELPENFAAE